MTSGIYWTEYRRERYEEMLNAWCVLFVHLHTTVPSFLEEMKDALSLVAEDIFRW